MASAPTPWYAAQRADAARQRARKRLDDHLDDLAAVAADVDAPPSPTNWPVQPSTSSPFRSPVAERAEGRAGIAERNAADAETALRDVERQLDHLERGDLLATGDDIETVRQRLVDRGIGAVTGWEWLARNVADPDERRRRIAARPDVVNGVIVTDASRLADAETILAHAELELRVAVLVAPSSATAARSEPTVGFVIEPHRALWDRQWAERTRDEMRTKRDQLRDVTDTARAAAGRYRRATVELSQLVRRWPADVAASLPDDLAAAESTLSAATGTRTSAETEQAAAETALAAAQDALNAAVVAAAEARVGRLDGRPVVPPRSLRSRGGRGRPRRPPAPGADQALRDHPGAGLPLPTPSRRARSAPTSSGSATTSPWPSGTTRSRCCVSPMSPACRSTIMPRSALCRCGWRRPGGAGWPAS